MAESEGKTLSESFKDLANMVEDFYRLYKNRRNLENLKEKGKEEEHATTEDDIEIINCGEEIPDGAADGLSRNGEVNYENQQTDTIVNCHDYFQGFDKSKGLGSRDKVWYQYKKREGKGRTVGEYNGLLDARGKREKRIGSYKTTRKKKKKGKKQKEQYRKGGWEFKDKG